MTQTTQTSVQLPSNNGATDYNDTNVHMIIARAHLLRAEAFSNDIAAIVSGLKKLASKVQTYFRARATARTLENLSDSVLADIGIERAQIPSIARELRNGTYGVAAVTPIATIETLGRKDADTAAADPDEMPLAA